MTAVVAVDLDTVNPSHLEELAALLRQRQWERAARLAELWERPTIGFYRQDPRRLRWLEAT